MQKSDLVRLNIGYLAVFASLMETGNVTASANELHMSQPAVSRALAQLRIMFADPLFVRAPRGVIPTERAQQLFPQVTELVDGLTKLLAEKQFDLASSDRTFRLATTDYGAGTVVRALARAFSEEATHATLEVVPFAADPFRDLAEGRLDLMLYTGSSVPDNLRSQFLFTEQYACLCRKGHPVLGDVTDGKIPIDNFLAWPHALVTVFGGRLGLIDSVLAERGLHRRIALRLPYFSTAPLIVAESDLLLTLPRRTAEHFASIADLECLETSVEIPDFDYQQVWHRRTDIDPAMTWLRELVKVCTA